jgi:hypothetical protein
MTPIISPQGARAGMGRPTMRWLTGWQQNIHLRGTDRRDGAVTLDLNGAEPVGDPAACLPGHCVIRLWLTALSSLTVHDRAVLTRLIAFACLDSVLTALCRSGTV